MRQTTDHGDPDLASNTSNFNAVNQSEVDVIIPHYRGAEILVRCLASLQKSRELGDEPCTVYVVDNACEDASVEEARRLYPWVHVIRAETNLGYAGGCNFGIASTGRPFIVLLNDDAVVDPGWLSPLVAHLRAHSKCAAVQPKILSLDQPDFFDYAGAAGGLMDVFGFPFARGRVFSSIERDTGQYNTPANVFWASGACTLIRREVLAIVGVLDASFFAHMEEIDLNWRMLLAGFTVDCLPCSVVRHNAGTTLAQHSPRKLYLNHRNSMIMLLKNYTWPRLLWVLPVRLGLEVLSLVESAARLAFPEARAIGNSWVALVARLPHIRRERTRVATLRVRSDREVDAFMYRRCLVWDFYIRRRRVWSEMEKVS